MGFYRDQVLPRFQDKVMNRKAFGEVPALTPNTSSR